MATRRTLIGGTALLALVAVVGLASRATTPAGGGGPSAVDRDILLEYVLLLSGALALGVLLLGISLVTISVREGQTPLPPRGNWLGSLLVMLVVLGIATAALLVAGNHFRGSDQVRPRPASPAADQLPKRLPSTVRFDWGPVVVVSILLALGLAAAAFVLLRRRRAEPQPFRAADRLALAVERTIADLRAEPDPRRAVIAAYAQMERALGDARLPRAPAEAPREYLGRVLPDVGAGAASVERLTALFEPARFSPHTIDAAMKEEAISALESLRDDLREPE